MKILSTMAIVFALELGHCRSRFLRAPRRQPDGAGNDPLLLVRPHHLRTQSRYVPKAPYVVIPDKSCGKDSFRKDVIEERQAIAPELT